MNRTLKILVFGMIIAFGINLHGFSVYYYDWQFVYFQSPTFLQACDAGKMDTNIAVIISKQIEEAAKRVQYKKGKESVVVVSLDLEEMDPLSDVTNEVYDEMCRG